MPKPARCKRAFPGFPALSAFTIIELLIVMAVIIILAGLILVAAGYVREKGYRSRAEAEIAAISAAIESYKVDNGVYPTDVAKTENLDPTSAATTMAQYKTASSYLYGELGGDRNFDGAVDAGLKTYMAFKPPMLQRDLMSSDVSSANKVTALRDPFGNSYGYSTMRAANPAAAGGFNPTFDLWSTAGTTSVSATDQLRWIKNW